MSNKRIISMLLTIAMIFTFIPMSMATVSAEDSAFETVNVDLGGKPVAAQKVGNKYLKAYGAVNNSDNFTMSFTADEALSPDKQYTVQFKIRNEVTGEGSRAWRMNNGYITVGGQSSNSNIIGEYNNSYSWQTKEVNFTPAVASDAVTVKIQFGTYNEIHTTPFDVDDLCIYYMNESNSKVVVYSQDFDDAAWVVGEGSATFTADGMTVKANPAYLAVHAIRGESDLNGRKAYIYNDPIYVDAKAVVAKANEQANADPETVIPEAEIVTPEAKAAAEATVKKYEDAIANYNNEVTNTFHKTRISDLRVAVGEEFNYTSVDSVDGKFTYDTNMALPAGKYKLTAVVRNEEYNTDGIHTNGTSSGKWQSYYPSDATTGSGTSAGVFVAGLASSNEANYGINTKYWFYSGNHNGKVFENLNNFDLTAKVVTDGGTYTASKVNLNYLWTEYTYEFSVDEATTLDSIVFTADHAKAGEVATLGYKSITLVQTEAYEVEEQLETPIAFAVNAPASAEGGDEFTVDVIAYTDRADAQMLNALNFVVNYDATALQLVELAASEEIGGVESVNGAAFGWFHNDKDGGVEISKDGDTVIATATFKVLATAKGGNTEIALGENATTKLNAKLLGDSSTFTPVVFADTVEIINNASVTVAAEPAVGGTVSKTSAVAPVGSDIVAGGTAITVGGERITAAAGDYYNFAGWFIGDEAFTGAYEVTDNADIEITAKFEIGKGNVVFTALNGQLEGAVDRQSYEVDAGTVYYVDGNSIKLKSDDTVVATVISVMEGYKFVGWKVNYKFVTGDIVIEKGKTTTVAAEFLPEHPFAIKADVNAGITEDIKYYICEGKPYADRLDTEPVTKLPEINPVVGETEKYVFADADKIWLYNGVAMTEEEVFAQTFAISDELKPNIKKQYLIKFAVDDASASILSIGANESVWADENAENVEFPEVTKSNEYYDAVWYAGDTKVDSVAAVTASVTYTVKAEAQDITHTVNYVNANGGSTIAVEDTLKATVTGGIGEKLVVTPKAIEGYVIEEVVTDGIAVSDDGNGNWTSTANIEAPAVITVKYRAYFGISFTDSDKASVEDVTYYAKDGEAGLYTDAALTTKVTELPEITYAAATADTRYVAAEKTWIVDGTAKTAEEILGTVYTDAVEITPAYVTEYKIAFTVDADSADYLEIAAADAEKWLAAGESVAFPTVTKKIEYCTYEWNADITSPVEGPAAYTVTAIPNTYSVTVNGALAGQVTADANAAYGTDYSFTVTENADYDTAVTVKVNGTEIDVTGAYTVAGADIKGDIEITVANTVTVTIVGESSISVTAGNEFTVPYGGKLTADDIESIVLVPAQNYIFDGWLVGDADETVDGIADIVFTKHTTIKATAKLNTVFIKIVAGDNGTVSQTGYELLVGTCIETDGNTLTIGGTVITTATADTNYKFKCWIFNGNTEVLDGEQLIIRQGMEYVFTAHFEKVSKTATFTAANGTVDKASATVYAGDAITVNGNVLTVGDTVVTATANTNYKFVGWKLGGADITATAVTADGTYDFTAEFAIITKDVTVTAGANGSVDKTAFTANAGDAIAVNGNKLTVGAVTVTATAANGYKFAGWKLGGADITATAITADGTYAFTAEFAVDTVDVTIAAGENGQVDKTTATAAVGKAITVDGASLKIDGTVVATATANTNYKLVGWFLNGADTVFETATVESGKTYAFTAKFEIVKKTVTVAADANGTVDKTSATVEAGKTITADGASLKVDGVAIATATAKAGYKFQGWFVGEEAFTSATVTADGTYAFTAKFVKNTYKMSVPAGVSVSVNGGAAVVGGKDVKVDVKIGDSVVITPSADAIVTAVYFNGTAITAADGKYTVPADKITADVAITVDSIAYRFITAKEYKALASNDYKILVIASDENNTDYTFGNYKFYYSSKYKGYVAIIGADVTATQIAKGITSKAGSEIAIKYNGDVNGDGFVSAADAAIVSEMLHAYGTKTTVYTDIMRLEADVFATEGAYVTATDCTWILYKSVGLTYPAPENKE